MHGFVADLLDFHSPLVGREDITKCDSDKGAFALLRFFPCGLILKQSVLLVVVQMK